MWRPGAGFSGTSFWFSEGRNVATFARDVPQMWHIILIVVFRQRDTAKWRKRMAKPRTERSLLFPSKEFREKVRQTAKNRGFRSEQAFILAACENEMRRGD